MRPAEDFKTFWPRYLAEHRHPMNRALHVFGTCSGLLLWGLLLSKGWWMLSGLALLLGYGPAWIGHLLIEKNRPATLTHPLYSLAGDLKMCWLILTGELEAQLRELPEDLPSA